MRVTVRVYPGSSSASVGGRYGSGEPPVLVVRVRERAVDGQANEAVLTELARAFGITRRDARLVRGHSSRTKLIELPAVEPALLEALLTS